MPAKESAVAQSEKLKLTLPTGRIQEKVVRLLGEVGMKLHLDGRSYRPACSDDAVETKMLKAQNIPSLVALGRHDCGFSGHDWILEQKASVVELLDLGFDPVNIVAAVPEYLADHFKNGKTDLGRPIVVASEYSTLSNDYIAKRKLDAIFIRAFGATEALPPEDADMIIDNTATGATLRANRLVVVDEVLKSTTRFFCNAEALKDPFKRKKLEEMTMLMKSALSARGKVMLEMNVSQDKFEQIVSGLPCMRSPTVSKLYRDEGFAVKIAVDASEVAALIPRLVAMGATDILEYKVDKIVTP
jgi:ATP phosphoribosyltransferase